jgi:hypothetical protein
MTVPFPLAWQWSTVVRRASAEQLGVQREVELVTGALRREGAKSVAAQMDSIEFECPGVSGMSRYALLAPISGGSITFEAHEDHIEVTYALRFVLAFWASAAFGAIFAALNFGGDPLKVGALTFAWLFLGNVAISLFRFPRFLRRALASLSPPNTSLERTRER